MNAASSSATIEVTAQAKKPSSRYFSPRSGISSQRGRKKLRRKSSWPARHKYSEIVPTGHSQLQNALRNRNDMARNEINRNIPAGCSVGTWWVRMRYRKFIRPAIGSQPSTPAGRCSEVGLPDIAPKRRPAFRGPPSAGLFPRTSYGRLGSASVGGRGGEVPFLAQGGG